MLSSMDNIFLEVLLVCKHDDILYPTSHDYVVHLKMTEVYSEIVFHDHSVLHHRPVASFRYAPRILGRNSHLLVNNT